METKNNTRECDEIFMVFITSIYNGAFSDFVTTETKAKIKSEYKMNFMEIRRKMIFAYLGYNYKKMITEMVTYIELYETVKDCEIL